jgi:hypothetical protein
MKNDELYPLYLKYLGMMLKEGKLNRGTYSLLKMTKSKFEEFKIKLENEEFKKIFISEFRDDIINDIFDGLD